MSNLIDKTLIIPFDFYDELLVKYYGRLYEYIDIDYEAGVKIKVTSYVWNNSFYVSKMEVIK